MTALLFTMFASNAVTSLSLENPQKTDQDFESIASVEGRNAAVVDGINHTQSGSKSVRITSDGYKSNIGISQTFVYNPDNTLFVPTAGQTYVFTAYLYSARTDGDTVKFKLLNTNDQLVYTGSNDILFEQKNFKLPAKQWVAVSCRLTMPGNVRGAVSVALTANDETSTRTDDYYLDDVSIVSAEDFSSATVLSPAVAGLYTSRSMGKAGINIPAGSAVYTKNGNEYSAMRVYGEYTCYDGDYSKISVNGNAYPVVSRGLLIADPVSADKDTMVLGSDTVREAETSGSALENCWSYDASSQVVRYSLLLKDISSENADQAYAVRPFATLAFADGQHTFYGDIQTGTDGKGVSVKKLFESINNGSVGWYSDIPAGIAIAKPFEARFSVVYPADCGDNETVKQALELRSTMQRQLGVPVSVYSDAAADDGNFEILVGETNRSASADAYKELGNREYLLRYTDKKMVLAAKNEYSLANAAEMFCKKCCNSDGATIPCNMNIAFGSEGKSLLICGQPVAEFTFRVEKYPSALVVKSVKELQRFVLKKTGILPERVTAENDKELYVCVDELLSENEYSLTISGTKLTLRAGSAAALNCGIARIEEQLNDSENLSAGFSGSSCENDQSADGYSLVWNDEFNGDSLDSSNWYAMNDTTEGPQYAVSDSYYTQSSDKAVWITGNYAVSDIAVQTGIASVSQAGSYVFYDNISSATALTAVKNAIAQAGGKVILSGNVKSGYAMEGIQTRPAVDGDNYYVSDGCLHEVTSSTASGYNAIRVYSGEKMSYRYGLTEARMMMATNNGACSAMWLSRNQAEIDVYENYGVDRFFSNLHTWSDTIGHVNHVAAGDMKKIWVSPAAGEHFYNTFHHIGYEWTDSYIAFYLDGEIYNIVDISHTEFDAFHDRISLKFANGVGTGMYSIGNNPGNYVAMGGFRETQKVDSVRIYQRIDSDSILSIQN